MRRFLTYLGHFLTVNLLRLPQDATGALRVYKLSVIPRELFIECAPGLCILLRKPVRLAPQWLCHRRNANRLARPNLWSSKMFLRETCRSASRPLQLYWAGVRHPGSFLLTAPLPPILGERIALQDPQGWGRATGHAARRKADALMPSSRAFIDG